MGASHLPASLATVHVLHVVVSSLSPPGHPVANATHFCVCFYFILWQANGDDAMDEEESFFNLVTQFQSKRMDDQRCSLAIIDNKENQHASTLPSNIHGE